MFHSTVIMNVDEVKKETTQDEPSITAHEDMDLAPATAEETEPSWEERDELVQIPLPPNESISDKMDGNVTNDVPSGLPDDNMDVEPDVKISAVKDECSLNTMWETEEGKTEQESSLNEQVIFIIIKIVLRICVINYFSKPCSSVHHR